VTPEPTPARPADALRGALRDGLITALKSRDSDALAALRTAIAAIDNAEAVRIPDAQPSAMQPPAMQPPAMSTHVAGASSGAGSTEAARRQLSSSEVHDILRDQIADHAREADRYDTLGQADAAHRLRGQARALEAYLR